MRLSDFILSNTEKILAEFEAFARTIVPKGTMDVAALRDHAKQILTVIAQDLASPQTSLEAVNKSKGLADAADHKDDTPAQEHGSGRAVSGFTIGEMVSEYRALRSSVVRLWIDAQPQPAPTDMVDLVRFNEAIDQALTESIERFGHDLERTRDTFIGILGHDLRTPLGAIITSAAFLKEQGSLEAPLDNMVDVIQRSAVRMNAMVADLLDFTRGRLGGPMPITRVPGDLRQVIEHAVEEFRAGQPQTQIRLELNGDLAGDWDAARLSQVLSNLLSNAASHGASDKPIVVSTSADPDTVTFSVHNKGPAISPNTLHHVFNPLSRSVRSTRENHLGLGLYIAQQAVLGHGGKLEVESTEAKGTTFTVRLPRLGPKRRNGDQGKSA